MRLHLMEIHEQPWCPAAIRDGATDCLRVIANVGRQYHHALPLLHDALRATGATRVVDLCSGGGGPWPGLLAQLDGLSDGREAGVEVVLSDLHPNQLAAERGHHRDSGRVRWWESPVDATAVPADLRGFRTLFTAFHHFAPATARAEVKILSVIDAVELGFTTRICMGHLLFSKIVNNRCYSVNKILRPKPRRGASRLFAKGKNFRSGG